MRRILLDTNILIACFDSESTISEAECLAAKSLLKNLLQDPEVIFVITPLIRYEVLRFAKWANLLHFERLKQVLDGLTELDITESVSTLATHLYRLDQHECEAANVIKHIDKRNFDIFHFASAKVNDLELLSRNERDFTQVNALYLRLQAVKS